LGFASLYPTYTMASILRASVNVNRQETRRPRESAMLVGFCGVRLEYTATPNTDGLRPAAAQPKGDAGSQGWPRRIKQYVEAETG